MVAGGVERLGTTPIKQWPLFEAYPALAPWLAPMALCTLPTPVEALPGIAAGAWVKRDDLTHPTYGGNKMRKLEFVGAEVTRRAATRVITFGATGTNAGVAAAMITRQLGVRCDVLTFDQPSSSTVQHNAALMVSHGAHVRRIGALFWTVLAWYAHPRRLDPHSYFLFAGCSNPVAVFAYVNAAFELRAQIEAGACAAPKEIVVATGSVATLAGLTLGCALAGIDTTVVGIRVAPGYVAGVAACTVGVAAKMMAGCLETLVKHGGAAGARARNVVVPAPVILDDWYGPGYGATNRATDDAVAAAAAAGLKLEQTYTGKAFAAFLSRLPRVGGDALFWNTFNSR